MSNKIQFIIEYDSRNYCGAPNYCVVWATNEDEALTLAEEFMEGAYYEQDYEQYSEENDGEEPEAWSNVVSVEPLKESRHYKFYLKNDHYYPSVN